MKLKRELHGSETGADVKMVQRALNRWTEGSIPVPLSAKYDARTHGRVLAFQLAENVRPANGFLNQATLNRLWRFFDAYGRMRYRRYKPPTDQDKRFARLFAEMQAMSVRTPGYLLGGGHWIPLANLDLHEPTDCSSSVSRVLWKAGMLHSQEALLSWDFLGWGQPGKGKTFTVWTNGHAGDNSHVWIQLHRTRFWRFDTNPAGDTKSPRTGPHLRYLPRWTRGFSPRHWPGM